jgi:site-specific recombinase XerC
LKHAVRLGVIDVSPAAGIPTPKQAKLLPKNLTVDEVFALLDRIGGDDLAGLRDRALLEFLYATGLRVGELAALDLDDVDPAAGSCASSARGTRSASSPSEARREPPSWDGCRRPSHCGNVAVTPMRCS